MNDRHPIGEGHGLGLIVGHHDEGRVHPVAQLCELHARTHPERRVEVRERLVQQEELRLFDDRPADGDPLPLAARQLRRLSVQLRFDLQHPGGLQHAPADLSLGDAGVAQTKGHVVAHRHVRVERIVLEDHGDAPVAGGS